MCKTKRKIIFHPFLFRDGKIIVSKKDTSVIGMTRVKISRHHLYPRDRSNDVVPEDRGKILKLWEYKHFQGWNVLFQFCYMDGNKKKCSELTIDEIITLMIIRHDFITKQIGTSAWKILFKEKTLEEAIDLLCRMLSMKFNYMPQEIFPKIITIATYKYAA